MGTGEREGGDNEGRLTTSAARAAKRKDRMTLTSVLHRTSWSETAVTLRQQAAENAPCSVVRGRGGRASRMLGEGGQGPRLGFPMHVPAPPSHPPRPPTHHFPSRKTQSASPLTGFWLFARCHLETSLVCETQCVPHFLPVPFN